LAEHENTLFGECRRLDGYRVGQDVDSDQRELLTPGPGNKLLGRRVVPHMLIAIGNHGASAIPAALANDVDFRSKKGVGVADNGSDVEIVLPVLDGDVEAVASLVQVGDDRFPVPIAIRVDHVSAVTVRQQFRIQTWVIGPRFRVGTNPYLPWWVIGVHSTRLPPGEGGAMTRH